MSGAGGKLVYREDAEARRGERRGGRLDGKKMRK